MTGSEVYITVLTTGLAGAAGIAGYFAVKWMDRIENSQSEHSDELRLLRLEQVKTTILTESTKDLLNQTREEQHLLVVDVKNRIKEQVLVGVRSSTEKKIDGIQFDVAWVKSTTNQTILPALEEQKKSFGRVVDLDRRVSENEKNTRTLYEVLKREVEARKKGPL